MSRVKVERITCDSCGYVFEDDEFPNELKVNDTRHDDCKANHDLCVFCTDVLIRIMKDAKERFGDNGLRSCTHIEV